MIRAIYLTAALSALPALAYASTPEEGHTGPQTEGVVAPINLVQGSGAGAPMTYMTFEASVNHADLPECPKALAQEGRFCRAVLNGDSLHVFAFSEDGDQPLQAVLEVPMDQIRFAE